jgi:hypothetical protein
VLLFRVFVALPLSIGVFVDARMKEQAMITAFHVYKNTPFTRNLPRQNSYTRTTRCT